MTNLGDLSSIMNHVLCSLYLPRVGSELVNKAPIAADGGLPSDMLNIAMETVTAGSKKAVTNATLIIISHSVSQIFPFFPPSFIRTPSHPCGGRSSAVTHCCCLSLSV